MHDIHDAPVGDTNDGHECDIPNQYRGDLVRRCRIMNALCRPRGNQYLVVARIVVHCRHEPIRQ